jgi:hypothetical protein
MPRKENMILARLRFPSDDGKPRPDDELGELIRMIRAMGMRAIANCRVAAIQLFEKIEEHHGEKAARRIFAELGRPPSKSAMNKVKNRQLLFRVLVEAPKGNIHAWAGRLARENETLPRKERHGPSGTTDPATMERHLRRLLDQWNGKMVTKSPKKMSGQN